MGPARVKDKERQVRRVKKKRRVKGHKVKLSTLTQAIDALIGDEKKKDRQGTTYDS